MHFLICLIFHRRQWVNVGPVRRLGEHECGVCNRMWVTFD
jgi:hypothetical protein